MEEPIIFQSQKLTGTYLPHKQTFSGAVTVSFKEIIVDTNLAAMLINCWECGERYIRDLISKVKI